MKNIRLFIKEKNLDLLRAFADESYLYNYIVNNYSELPEDNIFRNPTFLKEIESVIYISKDDITDDDEMVWNETSKDLIVKNVSFFAIILDTKKGYFITYNNLKNNIPYLNINVNTDSFEAIKKIEEFNKNIEYEEEMEM